MDRRYDRAFPGTDAPNGSAARRMPRVLAVGRGDPFDRTTWSGASHHLFSALERTGALVGAVDATAPALFEYAAKAAAFHPRMRRWRERYEFAPVLRRAQSRYGARRLAALDPTPDALLQIGAYYDFSGHPRLRPRLRCSYHDANLALFRRKWTYVEDPEAAHIRATLRAEHRLLDRLDVIFAMSEWLRASFIEDFDQPPEKVVVVGAGVNNPALPGAVRRDWDRARILFVGFDWERKGGPLLLEAFRCMRAVLPDAELDIVGATRPAALQQTPGVTWHGPVDRSTAEGDARMEALHRKATVFATAPVYDPFPNAVLEAMSYGLPVVGVSRGSMPEMVGDNRAGLLIGHDDAEEMAHALLELATDTERARAFGEAGRQRVLDGFTWDRVADRMVSTIRERLS